MSLKVFERKAGIDTWDCRLSLNQELWSNLVVALEATQAWAAQLAEGIYCVRIHLGDNFYFCTETCRFGVECGTSLKARGN